MKRDLRVLFLKIALKRVYTSDSGAAVRVPSVAAVAAKASTASGAAFELQRKVLLSR